MLIEHSRYSPKWRIDRMRYNPMWYYGDSYPPPFQRVYDAALLNEKVCIGVVWMLDETQKSKRRSLKKAVATAAPQLAHALGGPLAGAAVTAISKAIFGKENVEEAVLADAIAAATPEQLLALKRADNEFRIALRYAMVEEARIDAGDRDSARKRQERMDDWTPSALGAAIILGFFIVLGAMVMRALPAGTETEFSIMLGALATMTAAVVNYFFGSSAGSKEKTRLMSVSPASGKAGLER